MSGAGEAPARTEAEIVAKTLPVLVGGRERSLRVLTMEESRKWKVALFHAGSGISEMDLKDATDLEPIVTLVGDRVLDLVVAYDVDATLGGREYVFKTASDGEVYAIFRQMLAASFPFVPDLRAAVAEVRALGLADLFASAQRASSTSGEPRDGVLLSTES